MVAIFETLVRFRLAVAVLLSLAGTPTRRIGTILHHSDLRRSRRGIKKVGEYVGPGEVVVCTIVALDTLSVELLLQRHFRKNVDVGDCVDVVFDISGQTVTGAIQYISPF